MHGMNMIQPFEPPEILHFFLLADKTLIDIILRVAETVIVKAIAIAVA